MNWPIIGLIFVFFVFSLLCLGVQHRNRLIKQKKREDRDNQRKKLREIFSEIQHYFFQVGIPFEVFERNSPYWDDQDFFGKTSVFPSGIYLDVSYSSNTFDRIQSCLYLQGSTPSSTGKADKFLYSIIRDLLSPLWVSVSPDGLKHNTGCSLEELDKLGGPRALAKIYHLKILEYEKIWNQITFLREDAISAQTTYDLQMGIIQDKLKTLCHEAFGTSQPQPQ